MSPLLILFFYFLHKDGVRGESLWPDRQFEVNFSVQFFGRESRCHMDNIQHTWYQAALTKAQKKLLSCCDFRNVENSIYYSPKMSLNWPGGLCFPIWGWNTHRIALQYFCWLGQCCLSVLMVEVCGVVPHWYHKLLWERGLLELTVMEFLDSHSLTLPISYKNSNASHTEEKKILKDWGQSCKITHTKVFWPKLFLHGCILFMSNTVYLGW